MLYLLIGSLLGSLTIFWTIPFFLFRVLGLSLYSIKDQKKIDKIIKRLDTNITSSLYNYQYGELKKSGFFLTCYSNCYSVGYIYEKNDGEHKQPVQELYLLISRSIIDDLLKEKEHDEEEIKKDEAEIDIYERDGNFFHLYYEKRTISFDIIEPNPKQKTIIDDIVSFYQTNGYCSCYLQGNPGLGKTTIAYFLASVLHGSICKTFKPIEPGDTLIKLIDRSTPSKEKPLVILLDEVNIMIRKIHEQRIERHKNIPISVYDKTTFNTFLDDMRYNKNIILLMTSNESKEQIDLLDTSYLRKGRINVYSTL